MSKGIGRFLGPFRSPVAKLHKHWIYSGRHAAWREVMRRTTDISRFAAHPQGPRVVYMSMIGNMYLTNFEVPLALALNARGARVEMIFDDFVFPLCELTVADTMANKESFCRRCMDNRRRMTQGLPLTVRLISELVDPASLERYRQVAMSVTADNALQFEYEGVPVGRPAMMVAMRHFRRASLDSTAADIDVLRQYVVSALITKHAAQRLADEGPIHAALMSHGIYTSWEPALSVFLKRGVRVAAYDRQPGPNRFQFNWDSSPQNGDIGPAWNGRWKNRPMTPPQRQEALDYLASRETFAKESCKYSDAPPSDPVQLRAALGIASEKTALLLVSNLVWDAAAVGRDLVFSNTLEWVAKTIEIVSRHPNLHLIVKPHPAEVMRGTKLFVGEEIRRQFPKLPANVTILPAGVHMNPMSLMKAVDVGIAHTSTAGLEMAALGKPVIPVSQAHYRGKGFTFDVESFAAYETIIARAAELPGQYTPDMRELALKYVLVRFFKYQHHIPLVREKRYLDCRGYEIKSLDDLLPGRMADLDFVCQAILDQREDFVRD
ncbi:MAG: hypothetical protein ABFD92_04585 [Planctomycetaceae bacterium]|nr:hypothetical protein [Planctomycetaceae bacterium]